jgi:hypothetical protein
MPFGAPVEEHLQRMDDHPEPHPSDLSILAELQDREGQLTEVVLRSGSVIRCFNIAWGYDTGDEFAHVTTNISPDVPGEDIDFFFTNEVLALRERTGAVLYQGDGA